jgi:hypothetical protein
MLKFERSVISVVARRFRNRVVVDLENLSVKYSPDEALNEKGPSYFESALLFPPGPNYFLTFAFRACAADP